MTDQTDMVAGASRPEGFVLAQNMVIDREMVWALGCLVATVYWWQNGRGRDDGNPVFLKFLREFDEKFSWAVAGACPVRDALAEPEASGQYLVWGGEEPEMQKWARRPRTAFWLSSGKGFSDPHVRFWQELPEGPVLKRKFSSYLKSRQGLMFWDWLGLGWKPQKGTNLTLSIMVDQETVDAVRLIEGYALRRAVGSYFMDDESNRKIGRFLGQFKAKFRGIVQNADPVVSCEDRNPDVPGKYLTWKWSRGWRSVAEWRGDGGWSTRGVSFWMRPAGAPMLRQSLSGCMKDCPDVDFCWEREISWLPGDEPPRKPQVPQVPQEDSFGYADCY